MKRLRVAAHLLLAGLALTGAGIVISANTASAALQWTDAEYVDTPDSNFEPMRQWANDQTLADGNWEQVSSLSCAARGECTVGAMFNLNQVGFFGSVITQTNGTWGDNETPSNWLNPVRDYGTHNVSIKTVECFASGACTLAGAQGGAPTFASKTNGVWSAPQIIPGLTCIPTFAWPRGCSWGGTFTAPAGTPNLAENVSDIQGGGGIEVMDCVSPGNCVAAGHFVLFNLSFDPAHYGGFITVQTNGVWSTPVEIPALSAMNDINQGGPVIADISCATASNCVVVGSVPVFVSGVTSYADPNLWCCRRAFASVINNGVPSSAAVLPGLDTSGESSANNVKCFSTGNCITTGFKVVAGQGSLFSSRLSNGTWSNASLVPGSDSMAPWVSWWDTMWRNLATTRLSCSSEGNCTLAGHILRPTNVSDAYVIEMTNGTWSTMGTIPGVANLGAGTGASVSSIDCPAAGECVAIGAFRSSVNIGGRYDQPYVAVKSNGVWGDAALLSGLDYANEAIDAGSVWKVSCAAVGDCAVAGNLASSAQGSRIFVASYFDPTPPPTTTSPAPETTLPPAPIAGALQPGLGKARVGTQLIDVIATNLPNGNRQIGVGGQTFTVPPPTLDLGRPIRLSGSGARPFSTVTVQLFSTPQVLGNFPVAADGTFSGEAIIPAGTPVGDHSLQMVSTAVDGTEVVVQLGVSVTGNLQLPATGSDTAPMTIAVIAALAGSLVILGRRRLITR
jgi:LPXTG-motif cell wall-anchored protein